MSERYLSVWVTGSFAPYFGAAAAFSFLMGVFAALTAS